MVNLSLDNVLNPLLTLLEISGNVKKKRVYLKTLFKLRLTTQPIFKKLFFDKL